jgi:hypothetical protein
LANTETIEEHNLQLMEIGLLFSDLVEADFLSFFSTEADRPVQEGLRLSNLNDPRMLRCIFEAKCFQE